MAVIIATLTQPLAGQCPDGTAPPCPGVSRAPSRPTIAVLYFETPPGDTLLTYLADGLTESLIDRLSHGGLVVVSHYQVRRYRNLAVVSAPTLGRALNASHLVTGTLLGVGPRLRISVEVISAASATRLWGQQFERPREKLLSLESEIATLVADSVVGRLQPAQHRAITAAPSTNPAAYDHYLRGRFYLAQRTEPTIRRAILEFEAASRLDPRSAQLRAQVGVADAIYASLGGSEIMPLQQAFIAADKALRLDSLNATAWHARALALRERLAGDAARDMTDAARAAQRSISLDSMDAEAWHTYGTILMDAADDDGASATFQRALALDPRRASTLERFARLKLLHHEFAAALELLDSAIAVEPGFNGPAIQNRRARALLRLGRLDEARKALDAGGDRYPGTRALLLVAEKDSGAAAAALASIEQPSLAAVEVLAALGETDRAIAILESIAHPTTEWYQLLRLPELDPLRDQPRFQVLLAASRPLALLR